MPVRLCAVFLLVASLLPLSAGRAGGADTPGGRGTIYVTCGGGKNRRGRPFPNVSNLPSGVCRAGTDSLHFFVLCEVFEGLFRAQVIDTSGTVFDRWEIRK